MIEFLAELWRFMRVRKKFWLLPILIILGALIRGNTTFLSVGVIIIAFGWAWGARTIRSMALTLREREFINMARFSGPNTFHILVREIFPYCSAYLVVGFIHTIRDALDVAARLDTGVCVDLYASWMERDLESPLRDNLDRIDLVQISDFVVGTLSQPNRWVPGDGDLPRGALLDVPKAPGVTGLLGLLGKTEAPPKTD